MGEVPVDDDDDIDDDKPEGADGLAAEPLFGVCTPEPVERSTWWRRPPVESAAAPGSRTARLGMGSDDAS